LHISTNDDDDEEEDGEKTGKLSEGGQKKNVK
jgi:hypothetical protein